MKRHALGTRLWHWTNAVSLADALELTDEPRERFMLLAAGTVLSDTMRLALWRLDSRVAPALAREDSRPYQHYDPLFVPLPVMDMEGKALPPGSVLEPSPLLNAVSSSPTAAQ